MDRRSYLTTLAGVGLLGGCLEAPKQEHSSPTAESDSKSDCLHRVPADLAVSSGYNRTARATVSVYNLSSRSEAPIYSREFELAPEGHTREFADILTSNARYRVHARWGNRSASEVVQIGSEKLRSQSSIWISLSEDGTVGIGTVHIDVPVDRTPACAKFADGE